MKTKNKYTIACLCGSTRFKSTFEEWNKQLTLQNCIVLMPGVFGHSGDVITEDQKNLLDDLHKEKIKMADFVLIIDVDGYIGASTREEIGFAKALEKPIYYLSDLR